MKTNPNDSAQPTMGYEYINQSDETPTYGLFGGLTKREHFAALAMQGIMAMVATGSHSAPQGADSVAKSAVEQADALITQLNKEE